MSRRAFLALVLLLCAAIARGATNDLWFPVGERLTYGLYWGVIPVGRAVFSSEWTEENGVRLVRLRATAKSNSVVSRIYPVDDSIESFVRPGTFLPLRYVQKLREGRRNRHDIITFDHAAGKAKWRSEAKRKKAKSAEFEIAADCRDVLSFAYFMRSRGFAVGQKEKSRVVVDEKVFDLELTGLAEEEVDVKGVGRVTCLKVEPKAKFGEIFVRSGSVLLWFSLDRRHLCTEMAARVPLASLKASLERIEGPGSKEWTGRREPGAESDGSGPEASVPAE